jgi:hypothetical protein
VVTNLGSKSMRRAGRAVLGAALALSTSAALSAGCGSDLGDLFVTPAAHPPANSFTQVYAQIVAPTCSSVFCHYSGVGIRYSALDMSSQVYAYWSLVEQPAIGPNCAEEGTRVVPGQPDLSIMYLKVSESMPPCGSQMPADPQKLLTGGSSVFSGTALTAAQQQLIHDWIAEGAQNN